MKTLKLITLGIVLLISAMAKGQVSVNINVGSPPQWGPVGYTDVRYYYLPDVEAYYDIETSMFIYYGGGVWVHRTYLPAIYSHYDLYNGYKVVITDYRGNDPYIHYKKHKAKYYKGYKGGPQKTIGQKPGKENSGRSPSEKKSVKKTGQSNGNNSGTRKSSGSQNSSGSPKNSGSTKSSGGHQSNGGSGGNKRSGGNKGQKGGGGKKK